MRRSSLVLVVLALCGAGCSETSGVAPKVASEVEPSKTRLGHYSTGDGFVGFVLDRSGAQPKVKFDDSQEVIELFVEPALDRGNEVGHFFNGPDGRAWLFVHREGGFAFIAEEKRVAGLLVRDLHNVARKVRRDEDAAPLGEPARKGIASLPPEKTPYDLVSEKFTSISAMKNVAGLKPEDSGNLSKVEQVLNTLAADNMVRVSETGAKSAVWAPASPFIGDADQGLGGRIDNYPADASWDPKAKGLAGYGGTLDGPINYGSPSRLSTFTLKGWPGPLDAGTPGFIWMVHGTTVVFVTLDGGRYHLSLSGDPARDGLPIEYGLGKASAWPAPLQHSLINVGSIRGLAKGGAIPAAMGTELETVDDGWFTCVDKVWEEGKAAKTKTLRDSSGFDAKVGSFVSIESRFEAKAEKDCAPHRQKIEAALVAFIEGRNKQRLALYEKAKARLK